MESLYCAGMSNRFERSHFHFVCNDTNNLTQTASAPLLTTCDPFALNTGHIIGWILQWQSHHPNP